MQHTIIINVPAGAPQNILERRITDTLNDLDGVEVAEYHLENMVEERDYEPEEVDFEFPLDPGNIGTATRTPADVRSAEEDARALAAGKRRHISGGHR